MKDHTKIDRVLILIQEICASPQLTLTETKVQAILGSSRSQWYRDRDMLINDSGQRKAILKIIKNENEETRYQLNTDNWYEYLEGTQELQFILKFYKELGHLFPKIDTGGITTQAANLERKFHYLCRMKVKNQESNNLEAVIRSLVGNRSLIISYQSPGQPPKNENIYPLTLTQYRDDLYLLACKNDLNFKTNLRNYKLSRILNITETENNFKYPSKWDPREYYNNSSGIIVGPVKEAHFRLYGKSKDILAEKLFLNASLVVSNSQYDEYTCSYTNIEEFLGFMFTYAQDIEIISDSDLKKSFIEKAKTALTRNS